MIKENTQHIASISYGKDSLAMLHVIKEVLHLPLDRIVTAEVWATDTIQADLPPMVEFKDKADKIIKERWGIDVERLCATDKDGNKKTYEKMFYHVPKRRNQNPENWGFPKTRGGWYHNLKTVRKNQRFPYSQRMHMVQKTQSGCETGTSADSQAQRENAFRHSRESESESGGVTKVIEYIGIAADEPERVERHSKNPKLRMPLVEAGWTEQMCRDWCEQNDLLSPIYRNTARGGCWFCHYQSISNLRFLRKEYPDLWNLLLKWDSDSPTTFRADGHTVHDFEKRFAWEDAGFKPTGKQFRWSDVENAQMNIFQFIKEEDGED